MLGRGVTGNLTDFGLDGSDAVDGAEGDGDGVGCIGREERVETVEVFEVEGQWV